MHANRLRAIVCTVLAINLATSFASRLHAQELPEIPQAVELNKLIRQSMGAFSDAVIARRFDKFRQTEVCGEFLNKTSARQMGDKFKPFIDNHIDLTAVKEAEIVIDGDPSLVEGVLRVAGHFETQPMRVLFDLAYMMDDGKWHIYGITVALKKRPPAQRRWF